jgi:protoporphyrinogen oxidase
VTRQAKAYPVYDEDEREHMATIRRDLEGFSHSVPGGPHRHA